MSLHTLCWAFDLHVGDPKAKLLLIYMSDDVGTDGICDTPLEKLAEETELSFGEIEDALQHLVWIGAITGSREHWYIEAPLESITPDAKPLSVYRKSKIPKAIRERVFAQDKWVCRECGCSDRAALTVDHIYPEVLGGTLDVANLQTLCRPCNSRKGIRIAGEH